MAELGQAPSAPALTTPVEADPVARIQALLEAENPQPKKEVKAPEGEQEAQPEAEAEAQPNRQVEGEETQPEADEPKVEEIPLDRLEAIELEITVKGEDGKDVVEKPTVKELRDGYMRQKDYSRKTAEVARQREELAEKTRQAVEGERSRYMQELQTVHSMLIETAASELKGVDWNNLATNDPFEYVKLRNRADQFAQALSAVQAKQQAEQEKSKQEFEGRRKEAKAKAREVLEREIPGYNDNLHKSLAKTAEAFGYSEDEVSQWLDPRAIKVLHAAHQYNQTKAVKPSADKKVSTPPRVVKPGPAQASQAQQRHVAAINALRKSGTVQDAAAVIAARMG